MVLSCVVEEVDVSGEFGLAEKLESVCTEEGYDPESFSNLAEGIVSAIKRLKEAALVPKTEAQMAENKLRENVWVAMDLDNDFPPSPAEDLSLCSPVIEHLLRSWSSDSSKILYVTSWMQCLSSASGLPDGFPKGLELAGLSYLIKNGFFLLLIPLIIRDSVHPISVFIRKRVPPTSTSTSTSSSLAKEREDDVADEVSSFVYDIRIKADDPNASSATSPSQTFSHDSPLRSWGGAGGKGGGGAEPYSPSPSQQRLISSEREGYALFPPSRVGSPAPPHTAPTPAVAFGSSIRDSIAPYASSLLNAMQSYVPNAWKPNAATPISRSLIPQQQHQSPTSTSRASSVDGTHNFSHSRPMSSLDHVLSDFGFDDELLAQAAAAEREELQEMNEETQEKEMAPPSSSPLQASSSYSSSSCIAPPVAPEAVRLGTVGYAAGPGFVATKAKATVATEEVWEDSVGVASVAFEKKNLVAAKLEALRGK